MKLVFLLFLFQNVYKRGMTVCFTVFFYSKAVPPIVGLLPATVTHVVVNNKRKTSKNGKFTLGYIVFRLSFVFHKSTHLRLVGNFNTSSPACKQISISSKCFF